jgi:hypothetical protein
MAMSQREKLLAGGVAAVVSLFVGQAVVSSIQSGFEQKKQTIDGLLTKKKDQDLQMTAGLVASQKLNIVAAKSLSKSEEKARADYLEWLIELADEAKLLESSPRFLGETKDKDTYQLFKFQLTGVGTIENATQLLYSFYSKDYLHRITRFDVRPITNSKDTDKLTISLDCEVLALGIAKDKQPAPTEKSARIQKSLDEYKAAILERNLFSPANNPPVLEPNKVVDARVGVRVEHSIDAKDLDTTHKLTYELVGEVPEGLMVDKDSGKITWSSKEVGEYKVNVKATDSGIPARSTLQLLTIKVKEPPPPAPDPVKFDVASQAKVTALIAGRSGPEAWILSKTESKTHHLKKGDQLKLGGIEGQVVEIGLNYIELDTKGRRWTVGLSENLAEAYSRGQAD